MRGWLIFRPGDRDFERNIEALYHDQKAYHVQLMFREGSGAIAGPAQHTSAVAEPKEYTRLLPVKYVRLLRKCLAFDDEQGERGGEQRVYLDDIIKVRAKARRN